MTSQLQRLGKLGSDYRDPMQSIDWDMGDSALPWLPPSMLTFGSLEVRLPRDDMVRLSRIEFARICATGLWVEGLLISRVSKLAYPMIKSDEAKVILHEVREEAGHGLMFLEMINRAGLNDIPLLGRTKMLTAVARLLPARSAEFWALVYVGEAITDTFAVKALQQSLMEGNAICPVARQVLSFHHRDEARHIAAARALLEARVNAMSSVRKVVFSAGLKRLLPKFIEATLFPTAASLTSLGIQEPKRVAQAALGCSKRREAAKSYSASALKFLSSLGLSDLAPSSNRTFSEGHPDEVA
jgi:hypothetical protein